MVRVLTSPVRPGVEPGPLALRRRWLDERRGGESTAEEEGGGEGVVGRGGRQSEGRRTRLRVMCYNILADM